MFSSAVLSAAIKSCCSLSTGSGWSSGFSFLILAVMPPVLTNSICRNHILSAVACSHCCAICSHTMKAHHMPDGAFVLKACLCALHHRKLCLLWLHAMITPLPNAHGVVVIRSQSLKIVVMEKLRCLLGLQDLRQCIGEGGQRSARPQDPPCLSVEALDVKPAGRTTPFSRVRALSREFVTDGKEAAYQCRAVATVTRSTLCAGKPVCSAGFARKVTPA